MSVDKIRTVTTKVLGEYLSPTLTSEAVEQIAAHFDDDEPTIIGYQVTYRMVADGETIPTVYTFETTSARAAEMVAEAIRTATTGFNVKVWRTMIEEVE